MLMVNDVVAWEKRTAWGGEGEGVSVQYVPHLACEPLPLAELWADAATRRAKLRRRSCTLLMVDDVVECGGGGEALGC